jgi:predicted PurR-regulated permease PerM
MEPSREVPTSDPRIRRALLALLVMLNLGVALALFTYLRPVITWVLNILSPFIVALMVAYIFNPLVRFLQHRFRMRRTGGVVAAYAIILCATVALFAVLLPVLYAQMRNGVVNTVNAVPSIIEAVSNRLHLQLTPDDAARIRDAIEGRVDWDKLVVQAGPLVKGVMEEVVSTATSATRLVASVVKYTVGFFAFVAFVVMITFYFLLDFGRINRIVRAFLSPSHEARFFDVWHRIDHALGGFLRGQLAVCSIIAILYSIALMVLGMKQYAILVGFLAGLGNLIPYAGPVIGAVPTVLWVLFSGAFVSANAKIGGVLAILLISVAIQSLDGFLLQPRIVGRSAGLHPLLVLIALVVGAQFGLGGLVLAVPGAIVARVLLKELWWEPLLARRAAEGPGEAGG